MEIIHTGLIILSWSISRLNCDTTDGPYTEKEKAKEKKLALYNIK